MDALYLGTAFFAGLISFLAPCVLPIIPGFLAYLGGATTAVVDPVTGEKKSNRKEVFLNSVFFVLGFSVIFALLGVLLQTTLKSVGADLQLWLSRAGGIIIIVFGLYLSGFLHIAFLEKSYTIKAKKFSSRYFTSFVFGIAFAVGWSPCAGAVLGSILALAATAPVSSFFLLLAYSIGLGVPFLLVGLFTAEATAFINKFGRASVIINKAFGYILIALGVLVFTDNIRLLGSLELITGLFK